MIEEIVDMINPLVSQTAATDVIERLLESGIITEREAKLMGSIIDREVLTFPLPLRDEVRSRMMTAMLFTLKYKS